MADQREVREVVVVRWTGEGVSSEDGLGRLLVGYHLRTEAEKGVAVGGVDELPERYRAEISDPRGAFGDDVVLVALSAGVAVGCLVVTVPVGGAVEVKRLWTEPGFRGRGVASELLRGALAHAVASGVGVVRLSVWAWRTGAIALYERFGFVVVESWDVRDQLVCMEWSGA